MPSNGYFFKTPTSNTTLTEFEIGDPADSINLSSINPLSITVWIKIFGMSFKAAVKSIYTLFGFYTDTSVTPNLINSFIGIDNLNKRIIVNIDNKNAFNVSDSSQILGKWSHFGLSFYSSPDYVTNKYPNMINLMINQNIIVPVTTFDIVTTKLLYNKLTLSNDITALYSDLRLYNQFYLGTYSIGTL